MHAGLGRLKQLSAGLKQLAAGLKQLAVGLKQLAAGFWVLFSCLFFIATGCYPFHHCFFSAHACGFTRTFQHFDFVTLSHLPQLHLFPLA